MASPSWTGGAMGVSQVGTITIGTYDAATTYTLTIGSKFVSTIAQGSANATAATLSTLWNAQQAPNYEFLDAITAVATDVITFTGTTPGVPFTVTPSVSGGAGTIGSYTAVTACTGPNFWDNALNWSTGAVPVTNDTPIIDGGPSILYNILQSSVTLASLTITENFPSSSQIGLSAQTNPTQPATGYYQYRQQRLKIGITKLILACQSNLCRFDLTPATTTVIISDSGQPITTGGYAIDLLVNSGSDVVNVLKGNVGINSAPGDTGTLGTLNVSFVNSPTSDAIVQCGTGTTLTTLNAAGGQITLNNSNTTTTINNTGATINLAGSGTVTTVNNDVGTINHSGSGNVTTLNNNDTWNRRGQQAATLGTLKVYAGSQGGDPNATYTYTNAAQWVQCRPSGGPQDSGNDIAWWNWGSNMSVTL